MSFASEPPGPLIVAIVAALGTIVAAYIGRMAARKPERSAKPKIEDVPTKPRAIERKPALSQANPTKPTQKYDDFSATFSPAPRNPTPAPSPSPIASAQAPISLTASAPARLWDHNVSLVMQVLVSLVLLIASLDVILSGKYAADQQHWAYGSIGTIVGFWLKSATAKE